jgi:hypothetical protein
MQHVPLEIVHTINSYLPDPDTYCELEPPLRNPNKTRAVNRSFRSVNGPKRDTPCQRDIFHYCRTPVWCRAHTDEAVLEALRTVDTSAAHAVDELRRHQSPIYGPPPYTAFIHILEKDIMILGLQWQRELALPDDVIISGSCCDGMGVAIQLLHQRQ